MAFLPTSTSLAVEPEACEFRVINSNAGGCLAPGENAGMDGHVAQTVALHAAAIDANVITLQEVTDASLFFLTGLLPGWSCYPHLFGRDNIAVCVDGTATNFFARSLTADPDKPDPDPPGPPAFPWWGYVQVEYQGVPITSVHTRSFLEGSPSCRAACGRVSSVIAGDFNHIDAADPGWHQTDLDEKATFFGDYRGTDGQWKIDHILTVEEPEHVSGDATRRSFSARATDWCWPRSRSGRRHPPSAPGSRTWRDPIDVDGSCVATVQFEIAIHDNCCLDPNKLALKVMASNPTANATLGLVSLDSPETVGPRDVKVTGRVAVSALQSCPAEVVINASAKDCAGNASDTAWGRARR